MSEAGIIAVVTAILTFLASVISAAFVSIGNRNKTIKAMEDAIRSVKEESKATDQEMHAEILMLGQQMESSIALVRKDITTLSERVEKHNSVIERVYKLEQESAVQAEQIKGLERSGK